MFLKLLAGAMVFLLALNGFWALDEENHVLASIMLVIIYLPIMIYLMKEMRRK